MIDERSNLERKLNQSEQNEKQLQIKIAELEETQQKLKVLAEQKENQIQVKLNESEAKNESLEQQLEEMRKKQENGKLFC